MIGIIPKGEACTTSLCNYREKCEITPYHGDFCTSTSFAEDGYELCPSQCRSFPYFNEGTLYPYDAVCYNPAAAECSAYPAYNCGTGGCNAVHECLPITGIICNPNDECCDERGVFEDLENDDNNVLPCTSASCVPRAECVPKVVDSSGCDKLATALECEGRTGKRRGCAWHYTGDSTKYRQWSGYCYNARSECY